MAISLDGTSGISASGNISGNNVIATGTLSAGVFSPSILSVTGNVTGDNLLTGGLVSATGNVSGNYILGNGALLTGVVTSVSNISAGTSNVVVVDNGSNIAYVGTGIQGTANVILVQASGMQVNGDLTVTGNATLSGNILGDRIQNGTTTIDIQTQNGNANISIGGTSNVAVFATTGQYITGLLSATGTVTAGNVTTAGNITTTGSISATGNITSAGNISGLFTGNITTAGAISTTGNVTASTFIGNVTSIGRISTTGNITGVNLSAGNSMVVDSGAYGNVTTTQFASVFGSGGGSNPYSIVQVRSSDGVSGVGMQAYTGSGILYGNTAITFALGEIRDKDVPASLVTKAYIDSTGLNVTGIANISGNITGGNISTGGVISATGNISGSYINGNGAFLTGVSPTLTYSTGTATGDGTTVAFTISAGRAVDNMLVFVNGICFVPTTDYTISSTTLTFTTAPANLAEITFRYLPI